MANFLVPVRTCVMSLCALLLTLCSAAAPVQAQGYPIVSFDLQIDRYDLQRGLLGYNVFQPPGFDEQFLEDGLNPYYWQSELGSHDSRLTVTPRLVTIGGLTNLYRLTFGCINCIANESLQYRYTVIGPAGETRQFEVFLRVYGAPVGSPCSQSKQCAGNACVDGVCCNRDCNSGVQAAGDTASGLSLAAGPAGACMACSMARGATADGTCTLVSADDRCQHGTCVNDPVNGSDPPTASCLCATTAAGTFCDKSSAECETKNGGCDPLTACSDTLDAPPTCAACPSGYTGDGASGCVDIDECATNNGGCDSHTSCTNQLGAAPTCGPCPNGYSGNGLSGCVDINECDNDGCDSITTCTNEVGAAPDCSACPSGYTGSGAANCLAPVADWVPSGPARDIAYSPQNVAVHATHAGCHNTPPSSLALTVLAALFVRLRSRRRLLAALFIISCGHPHTGSTPGGSTPPPTPQGGTSSGDGPSTGTSAGDGPGTGTSAGDGPSTGTSAGSSSGGPPVTAALQPVIDHTRPTSAARNASLLIFGSQFDGASHVTVGGVEQTFLRRKDGALQITSLANETPVSTQPIIVSNTTEHSVALDVTVLEPLDTVSVQTLSATIVAVTFSRDVDPWLAPSSFTLPGLGVIDVRVAGSVVSIETAPQGIAQSYALGFVDVADTFEHPLVHAPLPFEGFTPPAPLLVSASRVSIARGSQPLVFTGEHLAGVTSVTIGGVTQTVVSNSDTQLVIDVPIGTPLGAQTAQVTTASGSVSLTTLTVIEPLHLATAVTRSPTRVDLTFTGVVDPGTVSPTGFSIAGLVVTRAKATAAGVTLTTSKQTAGTTSAVSLTSALHDASGNTVSTSDSLDVVGSGATEFVVVVVGNGTPSTLHATPVRLERRFIATGEVNAVVYLPTEPAGNNFAFTLPGNVPRLGALTLSPDAKTLALAGGTTPVFESTLVAGATQVIATVTHDDFEDGTHGSVQTTLPFSSVVDSVVVSGTQAWVGTSLQIANVTLGSPNTLTTVQNTDGAVFGLQWFSGSLLYAVGDPDNSINSYMTPLPVGVIASFTPFANATYLTDLSAGVRRYNSAWQVSATFGPAMVSSRCKQDGADVLCIAATANQLYSFRDVGGASPSSATAFTALASPANAANLVNRGIAWAPEP